MARPARTQIAHLTRDAANGHQGVRGAGGHTDFQAGARVVPEIQRRLFTLRCLLGSMDGELVRGDIRTAQSMAEELLRMAESTYGEALLLPAYTALGVTLSREGKLNSALEVLGKAISMYDSEKHQTYKFMYGHDPCVVSLSQAAWDLWLSGYPERALERNREAIALAQEANHPLTLVFALHYASVLHQFLREATKTQEVAEATTAIASEHGLVMWVALSSLTHGHAISVQGRHEEGIQQFREWIIKYDAMGSKLARPHFLVLLAEMLGKIGMADNGVKTLDEALAEAAYGGDRYYEAEIYRLKGELIQQTLFDNKSNITASGNYLLTLTPTMIAEAESCFERAVEVARKQQAKLLELRATVSLSRLYVRQGKRHEARARLEAIYTWFTEGFDTLDLIEAKMLLEELTTG
jgi:predicted ATPase